MDSASTPAQWTPPPLDASLFRSAFGSTVVEEFVKGHTAGDVIRELVQNEFDAGGNRLLVTFGADGLSVSGNGRAIDKRGWSRLTLLLGTGRVVGDRDSIEEVAPKENGIGSKNFGLRSLFLFGDRIYVRSAGKLAVLDLPALGTQQVADSSSRYQKGVRIFVPYRAAEPSGLEAFSEDREAAAIEDISRDLANILLKLIVPGTRGIREAVVISNRTGRKLIWHQEAQRKACSRNDICMIRRAATLTDIRIGASSKRRVKVEEFEFQRIVGIPSEHQGIMFPSYFRVGGGQLRIGASVPTRGNRIEASQHGRFYYPPV